MATIDPNRDLLTVIVSFDVKPGEQEEVFDEIRRFVDDVVRQQPGFVSSALHKSGDGRRILNYAQWESRAAYDAFRTHPRVIEGSRAILSRKPDGREYEVAYAVSADG